MSAADTLDSKTIATVQSTIPLLVETGPEFTAHFYKRMFKNNPELKDVFNMSNQVNGEQPRALFNAIALYASNLENLAAVLPVVEKIAQKHVSFQVTPEQYDIVGANILGTLEELYHPGEEVINAWAKAYGLLAQVFINREAEIYKEKAVQPGGWKGTRKFFISAKIPQSATITSFEFKPVDGKPIADYKPGQYLTISIKPDGFANQEIRQYSLTRRPNGESYRIAVKREKDGQVSSWLHNKAKVGDVVDLVVPLGDFFLDVSPTTPVTLISAGVGLTPLLSMLDTLSGQKHPAQVNWLHATSNGDVHAFAEEIRTLGESLPNFKSQTWYSSPTAEDVSESRFEHKGHMVLGEKSVSTGAPETQYYLCGPLLFMQVIAVKLVDLGVNPTTIHYEAFGPHKVL